ncbi:MAG: hypothetical protein R3C28_24975 [Pirellulaceae bacterium]
MAPFAVGTFCSRRLQSPFAVALDLTTRDGALVAGWYTVVDGDMITNYFAYVMNLEQRVLVKMLLLM